MFIIHYLKNLLIVYITVFLAGLFYGIILIMIIGFIGLIIDFLGFPFFNYLNIFSKTIQKIINFEISFLILLGIPIAAYFINNFPFSLISEKYRPPNSLAYKIWKENEKSRIRALENKNKISNLKDDIQKLKLLNDLRKNKKNKIK